MWSKYPVVTVVLAAVAVTAQAQTYQRRATNVGGGNPNQGRCVVEVVVDGAAQVEIRGDSASLRNLSGQPPQWKRFECTATMPANPINFHFAGVDGRGKQELIQAPQNNGTAVIRLEDSDNGSEGYTFEVTWGEGGNRGGGNYPNQVNSGQGYPNQAYPNQGNNGQNGREGGYREQNNRVLTDDAVRYCQSNVRQQANQKYGNGSLVFRSSTMDDNPGRNDWVKGVFEMRSRNGRVQNYRFSCAVDFNDGDVRSVEIQPLGNRQTAFSDVANGRALQACEVSVERRLSSDGYQRVDFGSVSFDDRPGRNDSITGTGTALYRNRQSWFDFSCSVDLQNGTVRSANVDHR